MCVLPECMSVHHMNATLLEAIDSEWVSDPLALKVEMVRSHFVGN